MPADVASAVSPSPLLANAIALSASRKVSPPWIMPYPLHISGRTVIRTVAPSASAATSSMPKIGAVGSRSNRWRAGASGSTGQPYGAFGDGRETDYGIGVRRRGVVWAVAAGPLIGVASLAGAASPGIDSPARVADRAQRLAPTADTDLSPEQRAIAEMVALINIERTSHGLASLRLDDRASAAAHAHAADMASMGRMQHTSSDGSDGGDRLSRAGFVWTSWGENIGAGFHDPTALFTAWMNSTNHRLNLLGNFTEVGVGVVTGSDGVPYWSLLVATAQT